MLKRALAAAAVQGAIGRLLGWYMLLVGWTTRWTHIDRHVAEGLWRDGGPVVACFWHGRVVLSHVSWAIGKGGQPAKVLISNSREGAIAADATRTVGAGVIRGSAAKGDKKKGGVEATREMIRHLRAGGVVAMAPDGPRGPRMRAQIGPVQLAKHIGAPIICFGWSTHWRKVFNSWDRFVLPFPFGRGIYVWSPLIHVPRDADDAAMEEIRLRLETELNRVTALADARAGVPVIAPEAEDVSESAPAPLHPLSAT